MKKQVVIVGAGPAGVGMGVVFKKIGIDFAILEQHDVGYSFKNWPKEMRLISPSFAGNFFGLPDLNAVTPDSSPAYSVGTEHPSGVEYASYLETVVEYYALQVETDCKVTQVTKEDEMFIVDTSRDTYESPFVIWATGEYQFPNDNPFEGAEYCIHNSKIQSWSDLPGDDFVIIGGNESGLDSACHLARLGKKVTVIDSENQLQQTQTDSSYAVSPYTRDRYREQQDNIDIITQRRVLRVEKKKDNYLIHTDDEKTITTKNQPILATGFTGGLGPVQSMFETEGGDVLVTKQDESTITSGLFLSGPGVKHGGVVFCFIYKFRQRFAVVGEMIAHRLGMNEQGQSVAHEYRSMNMLLDDLSCCDEECVC